MVQIPNVCFLLEKEKFFVFFKTNNIQKKQIFYFEFVGHVLQDGFHEKDTSWTTRSTTRRIRREIIRTQCASGTEILHIITKKKKKKINFSICANNFLIHIWKKRGKRERDRKHFIWNFARQQNQIINRSPISLSLYMYIPYIYYICMYNYVYMNGMALGDSHPLLFE